MARERAAERKLVSKVKARGGMCVHMTVTGQRGVPDRLILLPGYPPMLAELKRDGGGSGLSDSQIQWHADARSIGHTVHYIEGLVGVDEFFKNHPPKQ